MRSAKSLGVAERGQSIHVGGNSLDVWQTGIGHLTRFHPIVERWSRNSSHLVISLVREQTVMPHLRIELLLSLETCELLLTWFRDFRMRSLLAHSAATRNGRINVQKFWREFYFWFVGREGSHRSDRQPRSCSQVPPASWRWNRSDGHHAATGISVPKTNAQYKHSILKTKEEVGPRISLTFRIIKTVAVRTAEDNVTPCECHKDQ